MTLSEFNSQSPDAAKAALLQCCGAERWADEVMRAFPFSGEEALLQKVTEVWYQGCGPAEWREAFTHHPKIGDVDSLRAKFASTAHLAGAEQAGVASADEAVL